MILPVGMPRVWHLHLYLDPWLVRGVAAEAGLKPDAVEIPEAFGVRDPRLETFELSLL